ncbi:hypothetical protein [Viridibacillus arvi]|uniref:hypothetical protein n=1 Tax=Viridibacillus arvi TaxID=263475 RepID=UPI003D2C9186
MNKQEKEIHPYLENYKVNLKDYMDLVVEKMPKFKVKIIPSASVAVISSGIGHFIPKFELIYIQLFFYLLLIIPVAYMLNNCLAEILKWDYIKTNKRKGKLDYLTVHTKSYLKMPLFKLNDIIVNLIFLSITLFVWVINPILPTNILLAIGLFSIFIIGEQSRLKSQFFFYTRDNILKEMKQKTEEI